MTDDTATDLTTTQRPPWYELLPHQMTIPQRMKYRKALMQAAWEAAGQPGGVPDSERRKRALAQWKRQREAQGETIDERHARTNMFQIATGGERMSIPVYDEQTHGLAKFDDVPDREMNPGEIKVMWRRVWGRARITMEESYPYRVRTAWRIAREFARLQGLTPEGQTLANSLPLDTNAWQEGLDYISGGEESREHTKLVGSLLTVVRGSYNTPGVTLAPPPVPPEWLDDAGFVLDDYDPENEAHDPELHRWLYCAKAVVDLLGLNLPTPGNEGLNIAPDPDAGKLGVWGLLDPYLCRAAFPPPQQIMLYEVELADKLLDYTVEKGPRDATAWLRCAFGLSEREVRSMTKVARSRALGYGYSDPEEARAMMVMRLEKMLAQAGAALDFDAQIKISKQLMLALGLGKVEPETRKDAMARIIDDISGRRKSPELLPG